MDENQYNGLEKHSNIELLVDTLAIGTSVAPWIGGPISVILSNISSGRKFKRICDVLAGVISDLDGFKFDASEQYVKTDEFEEIAEKILKKVAEERNQEKRDLFRRLLLKAIKFPSTDYDEQIRYIHILEEIDIDHLKILKTLSEEFNSGAKENRGVQLPSLLHKIPEMKREQARDLIMHLNSLCVTEILTKDSSIVVTEFGRRFVTYIIG